MINIEKVLLPFALVFKSWSLPSSGVRSELDMMEDQIVQTGGTSPALLNRYVAALYASAFEKMPRSARAAMFKTCNIPTRGRDISKIDINEVLAELARVPAGQSTATITDMMKFVTPEVLGSVFRLVDRLKTRSTQLELQNEELAMQNAWLRQRCAVVDQVLDHARSRKAQHDSGLVAASA